MPRRTSVNDTPESDDDDDIPEGFQLRDTSSHDDAEDTDDADTAHQLEGWTPPTPAEDDAEVDAETLAGFKLNAAQSASDREMLSAPTGEYVKASRKPWAYTYDYVVGDKAKGDLSQKGRLFISFSGQIINDDWKGMVSFRISPDRRHGIDYQTKKVDPNKFDGMYRLWLQAEEYYMLQTGEAPNSVLDVAEVLSTDDEIVFRITKGRDIGSGSFVMGFKKQS